LDRSAESNKPGGLMTHKRSNDLIGVMHRYRARLALQVVRVTFYVFGVAGVLAAILGTVASVKWVSDNITSILLFELSTLLGYLVAEFGSLSARFNKIEERTGVAVTIDTPNSLYRTVEAAIREALNLPQVNKSLWIVSATGVPDIRPAAKPQ